jgi:hypothetical protein
MIRKLETRSASVFLLILLSAARAENDVIGTVELTLNGQEQVWFVLDPGDDTLPTGIWIAMGPERGGISIAAYRDASLQLIRDERTGSAVPAASAEVLLLSVGFPLDAREQSYTLPTQPSAGPASLMFLKDWSKPLEAYDMGGHPGQISLTRIDAKTDGSSIFVGTFNGILRNIASGETIKVEEGRFQVDGAPFFKAPSAQDR